MRFVMLLFRLPIPLVHPKTLFFSSCDTLMNSVLLTCKYLLILTSMLGNLQDSINLTKFMTGFRHSWADRLIDLCFGHLFKILMFGF